MNNEQDLNEQPNAFQIKKDQLYNLFPEVFTEGKIDFAKLKKIVGEENFFSGSERYALSWAGKADAYKALQTPSFATLRPEKDKSINFDDAQHIFIEGENLETLKVLQKAYFGKVKLIYIDPPYNTGSDSFIYPDRFQESKAEYLKKVGDLDDDGTLMREGAFRKNSKENGNYHSNWLSMMLPRLYIARNLLKDDGVIFVSIDDNEVHNLRCLMDEVFGEENFFAQIAWQSRTSVQNDTDFCDQHEYIVGYARNRRTTHKKLKENNKNIWSDLNSFAAFPIPVNEKRYKNPDNDKRGKWKADPFDAPNIRENLSYFIENPYTKESFLPPPGRCWRTEESNYKKLLEDNRIIFGKNNRSRPQLKVFYEEKKEFGETATSWFDGETYGTTTNATEELQKIFGRESPFSFPKPTSLIKTIIRLSTKKDELILDFFSGSGSTAQAVIEINKEDSTQRKHICIQLPEKIEANSQAHKDGYKTISDITRERIKRVISKEIEANGMLPSDTKNLGFKSFKLTPSNFKQWRGDSIDTAEQLAEELTLFNNIEKEGIKTENVLYELLLRSGKPLTTPIEKLSFDEITVYAIEDKKILFLLEGFKQNITFDLINLAPKEIIALDSSFNSSDELKTNLTLQLKRHEIKFTSI